jgi:hypothetical protein
LQLPRSNTPNRPSSNALALLEHRRLRVFSSQHLAAFDAAPIGSFVPTHSARPLAHFSANFASSFGASCFRCDIFYHFSISSMRR